MAPTIGRQWRGGPQDYAALCDYCDVRYLRSQLRKQANGRLACIGPGTNGCGAGLDEVSLDKINADIMRHRRKPTKHAGGRFDRLRTSFEDIFGATLIEYWDARKGIEPTSLGLIDAWVGQKRFATLVPVQWGPPQKVRFWESRAEFGGRPGVELLRDEELWMPGRQLLLDPGARPYIAMVGTFGADSQAGIRLSGMVAGVEQTTAQIHRYREFTASPTEMASSYRLSGSATEFLRIPQAAIGSAGAAQLMALDATKTLEFRAGPAKVLSSVDEATHWLVDNLTVWWGAVLTLIVIADGPTKAQIAEFENYVRSFAVRLP